ncbi:hypothetical protein [Thomasclavelia sp.]
MHIPNLDPYSFTGTAVILGYLLTKDFTINEQAALGAWFNVVGDILASNASWAAVLEERLPSPEDAQDNSQDDLDVLKEAIDKLKESIVKLQNEKKPTD